MKLTKEQKEKIYRLLVELVSVKTWEGIEKHSAKPLLESYMARLEEIL